MAANASEDPHAGSVGMLAAKRQRLSNLVETKTEAELAMEKAAKTKAEETQGRNLT